jgi:hypothetical protein
MRAVAFAVLALLVFVSPVIAQTHSPGEAVKSNDKRFTPIGSQNGTIWVPLNLDGGGNLLLGNPPQGWIYRYQSVLQDTMSRWGGTKQGGRNPDTTAVYKADGATTWVVEIYPSFSATSAGHVMALSWGRHPVQSRDSLSTFTMNQRSSHPVGTTGATVPDSLGSLLDLAANLGQPAFVDSLAQPGEYVLPIGPTPNPRGRAYVFTNISTDWISLRLRILQTFTTVGGALLATDANGMVFTFRINIYGYR